MSVGFQQSFHNPYSGGISPKLAVIATHNHISNRINSHLYNHVVEEPYVQEMILPLSPSVKLLSKKMLMSSDMANRFLLHVSETEKAKQRIRQRERTPTPRFDEEQIRREFTIIGNEIVGKKKTILSAKNRPYDVSSYTTPMPTVPFHTTPVQHQPVSAFKMHECVDLEPSPSPTSSPKVQPSVSQLHTAAFFPRRNTFHSKTSKRMGMASGIASLPLPNKPCIQCPNNHGTTAAELAPQGSQIVLPTPQVYQVRGSTMREIAGNSKQPTKSVRITSPEPLEKTRTVPSITLQFTRQIQPTVVSPPRAIPQRKPWNWRRSFGDSVSPAPYNSRLNSSMAIRSIATPLDLGAEKWNAEGVEQPAEPAEIGEKAENIAEQSRSVDNSSVTVFNHPTENIDSGDTLSQNSSPLLQHVTSIKIG